MKHVLITGMSGTGKSAAIQELAARGHNAYDLDRPEWSQWIEADPSDELTPAKEKIGFGEKTVSARSCHSRWTERCSSAAAPRT